MMYVVELENISKTFPGGVQANKDVTLRIEEGEVHGLLGENGAGKSTLMNILYGLLAQDKGKIVIRGEEVQLKSPDDAINRGVGMVHQHFKLIPPLTVTENIVMGLEPRETRSNRTALFVVSLVSLFLLLMFIEYLVIKVPVVGTPALDYTNPVRAWLLSLGIIGLLYILSRRIGYSLLRYDRVTAVTMNIRNRMKRISERKWYSPVGYFMVLLVCSLLLVACSVLFVVEVSVGGTVPDYSSSAIAWVMYLALVEVLYLLYDNIGRAMNKLGPFGRIMIRVGGKVKQITNLFLPIGFFDAEERIRQISIENGLVVDPTAKIADLSVGLQQRVEIIKTLYREANILILDEPTSVLTPQEVDELFETLATFKEAGKTIILITHKLRETMALCDRISVLRDGELVGTVNKANTSREELAQMMVGRPVVFTVEKTPASPGDTVLSIDQLSVKDHRGLMKVKGISLNVRAGEILGIAGVEGNGQTELVEALAGLCKPASGRVCLYMDEDFMTPRQRKIDSIKKGPTFKDLTHGYVLNLLWQILIAPLLLIYIELTLSPFYFAAVFLWLFLIAAFGLTNARMTEHVRGIKCWHSWKSIFKHGVIITSLIFLVETPLLILRNILPLPNLLFYFGYLALTFFLMAPIEGWIGFKIASRFVTEETEYLVTLTEPCQTSLVDITGLKPRQVRAAGMSHIPEDRHKRGLVLSFTVEENLVLGRHYIKPFASRSGLNLGRITDIADDLVDEFSIKTAGTTSLASTLSGGNQQKVVVAREIATQPQLLVAAQPTRGLDVGATEFIHRTLIALRDQGVAILLVSAELDEIRSLSDRISVIYDGHIVGSRLPEETDPQELGLMMAGALREDVDEEAIV
ncbi:MAG: ABC transporter ATP-binding protein [Candidatus Thorarchaeota archaeon]